MSNLAIAAIRNLDAVWSKVQLLYMGRVWKYTKQPVCLWSCKTRKCLVQIIFQLSHSSIFLKWKNSWALDSKIIIKDNFIRKTRYDIKLVLDKTHFFTFEETCSSLYSVYFHGEWVFSKNCLIIILRIRKSMLSSKGNSLLYLL